MFYQFQMLLFPMVITKFKDFLNHKLIRNIVFVLTFLVATLYLNRFDAEERLTVQRFNNFLVHLNTTPGRDVENLIVLHSIVGGGVLFINPDTAVLSTESLDSELNIEPEVTSQALFYPNPFRLNDGAILGYRLSRSDMDISMRMYDMRGNQIFRKDIPAGEPGAQIGYNKVPFNVSTLGHSRLSSGMYFYIILYDGQVLAKGKVGVAP